MWVKTDGTVGHCETCRLANRSASKCRANESYILPNQWREGRKPDCPASNGIVKSEEISELTGQLIDIFEDFLEEKGISIPNPEREADDSAILYGTDYGDIQTKIENILSHWEIIES